MVIASFTFRDIASFDPNTIRQIRNSSFSFKHLNYNPLSPISAVHMDIAVGPFTESSAIYQ